MTEQNSGGLGGGDFKPPKGSGSSGFKQGDWGQHSLKSRLRTLTVTPLSDYDILAEVEALTKTVSTAVVAAGGTAVGADAALGGEVAVDAVASILGAPIWLIVLIVLVVLLFIENTLYYMGSKIPVINHWLPGWIRNHFSWLNHLEERLITWLIAWVGTVFYQWGQLIKLILQVEGILPEGNNTTIIKKVVDPRIQREVQYLQSEIDTLQNEVLHISGVTVNKRITVGVPQNVWDDIHRLEEQVFHLRHDFNALNSRVDRALHLAQSVANQQSDLSQSLRSVRSVAVGWQDLQGQVQDLTTRVTRINNDLTERVDHQGQTLTQLAPLTILSGGGAKGLRTLRQLEDTPCMCPKFANIPNELGTALAVLEFVENG